MDRIGKFTVVKELIREKIDPIVLFEYYGISIPDRNFKYNKIRCACHIHGGDGENSFSFDLNSKQFTCFSRHCGEDPHEWWGIPPNGQPASRDIFLFIKLMEEAKMREEGNQNYVCSFHRAVQIASQLSGIPIDDTTSAYSKEISDKLDNQRWLRSMARVQQEIDLEVFSEDEIEIFKAQLPLCDYVNSRKFDSDLLDFYEVGYSPEGIDEPYKSKKADFDGRLIFPVRDHKGQLVGWSGRLCTDDKVIQKKYHKWKHKMDFEKGFTLYNYNNALPIIKDLRSIILVEGPFDILRLWSYGILNAVAVMGSSLTPEQLQLAIANAAKVYVWLDPDGAGKTGATRIADQLKVYSDVYVITSKADPDDLTFDEAYEALKSAEKYLGGEIKYGTKTSSLGMHKRLPEMRSRANSQNSNRRTNGHRAL